MELMSAWIRLMATLDGLSRVKHQRGLSRGLVACALAAPLLVGGCTKTVETSYRISEGQKEVALALDGDVFRLTFFEMKQAVRLALAAPVGTKFVANGAKEYSLPLDVGQQQNVYFDVVSDGTLVDGKTLEPRRIEFRAEGYERPNALQQPSETRIWSKAPNNKPYTPKLLGVQYRYALGATQQSMELNLGNFRHDPKSHFLVQGKAATATLVLKAAPGEEFVFSPKAASLDIGDAVPADATKAREYRIQMQPGQAKDFSFWVAGQSQRVQAQIVSVQYTPAP